MGALDTFFLNWLNPGRGSSSGPTPANPFVGLGGTMSSGGTSVGGLGSFSDQGKGVGDTERWRDVAVQGGAGAFVDGSGTSGNALGFGTSVLNDMHQTNYYDAAGNLIGQTTWGDVGQDPGTGTSGGGLGPGGGGGSGGGAGNSTAAGAGTSGGAQTSGTLADLIPGTVTNGGQIVGLTGAGGGVSSNAILQGIGLGANILGSYLDSRAQKAAADALADEREWIRQQAALIASPDNFVNIFQGLLPQIRASVAATQGATIQNQIQNQVARSGLTGTGLGDAMVGLGAAANESTAVAQAMIAAEQTVNNQLAGLGYNVDSYASLPVTVPNWGSNLADVGSLLLAFSSQDKDKDGQSDRIF